MPVKVTPGALQSVSDTLTALADMFRPSRLNFAKVCLYCETRWCASYECEKQHAVSVWGPCPDCDGFGCTNCLNGVVEMTQAALSTLIGQTLPVQRELRCSKVVA